MISTGRVFRDVSRLRVSLLRNFRSGFGNGQHPVHRGRMVVVPELVTSVVAAGWLRDQVQPELFIDELTLRPWRAADAPAVVRAYQDADVQQWHVRTMTDQEAEEWVAAWSERWAAETGAGWAVCDERGLLARMSMRSRNWPRAWARSRNGRCRRRGDGASRPAPCGP